jgi:hypothetical protein
MLAGVEAQRPSHISCTPAPFVYWDTGLGNLLRFIILLLIDNNNNNNNNYTFPARSIGVYLIDREIDIHHSSHLVPKCFADCSACIALALGGWHRYNSFPLLLLLLLVMAG